MPRQDLIIKSQAVLSADPTTPVAGYSIIYPKTDNKWYIKTSAGVVTQIGEVISITGTANQVIVSASTGAVTLSLPQNIGTTSNPTFNIVTGALLTSNAAAGVNKGTFLNSAGVSRWFSGTDALAEGGSNAGANFIILRYNDAGTITGTPISISRATGAITIENSITGTSFVKSGGTSSQFLKADGTVDNSTYLTIAVTQMAAIGATPNANGASISTNTLTLQPASASFGGVVTTIAQTFAGAKTFASVTATSFTKTSATATDALMGDGTTQTIVSAAYTPTLTNTTNVTNSGFGRASYTRVGSYVHVMVGGSITPTTANTLTVLTITLPINTGTSTQNSIGVATVADSGGTSVHWSGIVNVNAAGTAVLRFYPTTGGGGGNFSVQFDYVI